MVKRWFQNRTHHLPKISVVIAAYNRPRELELCLEGFRRQSLQDFELILADDGSKPEIEAMFKKFAGEVAFPAVYLWQEDRGWGKLRMLNWAILEAWAENLCFIDGDCIPHCHFVRAHAEGSCKNAVQCGRRVDLMDKISSVISAQDVKAGRLDDPFWMLSRILKDEVDFGWQGFYLPRFAARSATSFLRKPALLGSNMSLRKKWLMEVNGFDESFNVPGLGEDTDLERRLEMAGLTVEWITYRAIEYHVWHPLTAVGIKAHAIFDSLKSQNRKTALKGIQEFLPEYQAIPK